MLGGYRLDIDYMDRQQCALDGQFHYGTKHHSHVDAGPQICGAVGSLDDCRLGCCGLYIYKGLYFTSALYGLYAVVAFFGWRKWLSLMTEQVCDQTNKE